MLISILVLYQCPCYVSYFCKQYRISWNLNYLESVICMKRSTEWNGMDILLLTSLEMPQVPQCVEFHFYLNNISHCLCLNVLPVGQN